MPEPKCPLCAQRLVSETDVVVAAGGSSALAYTFAWVCTGCSAAFPIGAKSTVLKGARPLYWDGKKSE